MTSPSRLGALTLALTAAVTAMTAGPAAAADGTVGQRETVCAQDLFVRVTAPTGRGWARCTGARRSWSRRAAESGSTDSPTETSTAAAGYRTAGSAESPLRISAPGAAPPVAGSGQRNGPAHVLAAHRHVSRARVTGLRAVSSPCRDAARSPLCRTGDPGQVEIAMARRRRGKAVVNDVFGNAEAVKTVR